MNPVYSREDAIALLLLKEQVSRIVCKRNDTGTPDSLGDQLFRMSLKLSLVIRKGEAIQETMNQARTLLDMAENRKEENK